jgi:hypothetical protein
VNYSDVGVVRDFFITNNSVCVSLCVSVLEPICDTKLTRLHRRARLRDERNSSALRGEEKNGGLCHSPNLVIARTWAAEADGPISSTIHGACTV